MIYGDLVVMEVVFFVVLCEICCLLNNFFDVEFIKLIVEVFENLSEDLVCCVIVFVLEGKYFCVGVNFSNWEECGEWIDML